LIKIYKYRNFDSFLENFTLGRVKWFEDFDHRTPQSHWAQGVDKVFKIEESEKLSEFLKTFGINKPIPWLNKSKSTRTDYRLFYTKEARRWVEAYHSRDLELFDYEF